VRSSYLRIRVGCCLHRQRSVTAFSTASAHARGVFRPSPASASSPQPVSATLRHTEAHGFFSPAESM